jgi:integrase
MGLRVEEVLRMTWDKINLDERTIMIDGEVKNEYSIRTLPLAELVYQLLFLIEDRRGRLCSIISGKDAYRNRLADLLNNWKKGFYIAPKDLRNTLPSVFEPKGWGGVVLECWLGHSPKGMTGKHYLNPDQIQEQFPSMVKRIDEVTMPIVLKKTETKTEPPEVLKLQVK